MLIWCNAGWQLSFVVIYFMSLYYYVDNLCSNNTSVPTRLCFFSNKNIEIKKNKKNVLFTKMFLDFLIANEIKQIRETFYPLAEQDLLAPKAKRPKCTLHDLQSRLQVLTLLLKYPWWLPLLPTPCPSSATTLSMVSQFWNRWWQIGLICFCLNKSSTSLSSVLLRLKLISATSTTKNLCTLFGDFSTSLILLMINKVSDYNPFVYIRI